MQLGGGDPDKFLNFFCLAGVLVACSFRRGAGVLFVTYIVCEGPERLGVAT